MTFSERVRTSPLLHLIQLAVVKTCRVQLASSSITCRKPLFLSLHFNSSPFTLPFLSFPFLSFPSLAYLRILATFRPLAWLGIKIWILVSTGRDLAYMCDFLLEGHLDDERVREREKRDERGEGGGEKREKGR